MTISRFQFGETKPDLGFKLVNSLETILRASMKGIDFTAMRWLIPFSSVLLELGLSSDLYLLRSSLNRFLVKLEESSSKGI